MIDWDKPVQQRDGDEARVYTTSAKNPVYPVIGEFICDDGVWRTAKWTKDGHVIPGKTNAGDLVNVPQKHTMWVNVYRRHGDALHYHGFHGRHGADESVSRAPATDSRIACIEITFTEGEGLAETDTVE